MNHPRVSDVSVLGVHSAELGQEVAAFVVAKEPVDAAELAAFCRNEIAPYKTPRHFVFLPTLPRNSGGKVVKSELVSLFMTMDHGTKAVSDGPGS